MTALGVPCRHGMIIVAQSWGFSYKPQWMGPTAMSHLGDLGRKPWILESIEDRNKW